MVRWGVWGLVFLLFFSKVTMQISYEYSCIYLEIEEKNQKLIEFVTLKDRRQESKSTVRCNAEESLQSWDKCLHSSFFEY